MFLSPLLGGAGRPIRRCLQNCHPAAGLVPGFPWLTHPGLAVPESSVKVSGWWQGLKGGSPRNWEGG